MQYKGWQLNIQPYQGPPASLVLGDAQPHCFSSVPDLHTFNTIEGEYSGHTFIACEIRDNRTKERGKSAESNVRRRIICLVNDLTDLAPFYLMRANVFSQMGMMLEDAIDVATGKISYRLLRFSDPTFDDHVLVQGDKSTYSLFNSCRRQRILDKIVLLKKSAKFLVIGGHKHVFYSQQELYSVNDFEEQLMNTIEFSMIFKDCDAQK